MKRIAINNNYSVTTDGKVYSHINNIYLKPGINGPGYYHVALNRKTCLVHRLVAAAYLPNPDNLPCINHKDKNKLNNHVDNLEWCTYSENNYHRDNKNSTQNKFNSMINSGISIEAALYSLC